VRLGSYDEARVPHSPISSVEDLLAQLGTTDVVVATRFHNVLLALLLGKPVLAISFHDKCTSLMRDVGLPDYCHDVHEMNAERLLEQFQALEAHAASVAASTEARVEAYRRALDQQYESLAQGA
jgi:polysaccharide pyruvyl transferase WcaK-like protein